MRDALHDLQATNNECVILWIRSGCGIHGNEIADADAQRAIGLGDAQEYEVSQFVGVFTISSSSLP